MKIWLVLVGGRSELVGVVGVGWVGWMSCVFVFCCGAQFGWRWLYSGLGLSVFGLGGGGFRLDRCGDFGVQVLGHFPSQVDHLGTEVVKLVSGDRKHVPVVFFQALVDRPSCLGEVPCELEKSLVSLFVERVFGLVLVKFEWFGAMGVFGLVVFMNEGGHVIWGDIFDVESGGGVILGDLVVS